jgi:hypothetical protein
MPVIPEERTAEYWINSGERDLLRLKSLLVQLRTIILFEPRLITREEREQ